LTHAIQNLAYFWPSRSLKKQKVDDGFRQGTEIGRLKTLNEELEYKMANLREKYNNNQEALKRLKIQSSNDKVFSYLP
jgi:ABC-type phosphate transport system auxiliary subunit